ncbi:MAG: DUF427 domain-containing protein [Acidimicrobiia bacterium]|jgi:uncharacterized protein (DUF427 family)
MPKAVWNGTVLAESEETVVVEGNHYFPPDSVNTEYFEASDRRTRCFWKGEASYYDVVVGEDRYRDGAWYYPTPNKAAEPIKGHVAFYGRVEIQP